MLTYIYHISIRPAIICLILLAAGYAFAEAPTIGTIDRSQEMIREDEALRQRIGQQEKYFVKTILLKGSLKLPAQEAEELTASFQGQWLTKEDISQLIDSIKSAFQKKGIAAGRVNISYELKKDGVLEITANSIKGG
ncbi:MAG: POTRA domain-containing protein [Candidatus Omnitrophica bacterium]|nr:POTRA domain-containing protein [Candidatus Omnitrophota bacterium]